MPDTINPKLIYDEQLKMYPYGLPLKTAFPGSVIIFLMALLLAGCATHKSAQNPVSQAVVCVASKCSDTQGYSTSQLMDGLHKLLHANSGQKISICSANSKSHSCTNDKVCYFVLGGLLPGNGCAENLIVSDLEKNELGPEIAMKTLMPLSFIGTNVSCDNAITKLSVRSQNDITIELEPYHCSWMMMGQMKARFRFFIDRIDLDRGEIGGYWNHSVAGTGNGSGKGYALLKLPSIVVW